MEVFAKVKPSKIKLIFALVAGLQVHRCRTEPVSLFMAAEQIKG